MTDIVEFLTARLDEDEAAAELHLNEAALAIYNRATAHPRRKPCEDFTTLPSPVQERYRALAIESQPGLARVLRGVAAKRAIVALHRPVENMRIPRTEFCDCQTYVLYVRGLKWPCDTLKYLAAVYADHPDYKQTWRIEA